MINREKVTKGLECCGGTGMCFHGCPYHEVSPSVEGCTSQLAAEALELLKEQEAVPVIQREIAHMLFWCCSSCGVAITDGDKFCRNCGKGLIWA